MAEAREYELKFDLSDGGAAAILRHPMFAGAARRRDHLASTYFDTPHGHLRRKAIALRVRETPAGRVQTLKWQDGSAIDRNEWEAPCPGDRPEPTWLRATPLAHLFDAALLRDLRPVFKVDVERTLLPVAGPALEVEGALDEGIIKAGTRELPLCEFELELKRGTPDALHRLSRRLCRDLPLRLSLVSKAERGYALAEGAARRPSKDIHISLEHGICLQGAFASALESSLKLCLHNAALIDGGAQDDEAIHKTRIALRHIRALLQLFRPVLRRKKLKPVLADIKWISRLLGEARDRDVFRDLVRHEAHDRALGQMMNRSRLAAHAALHAALGTARWRLLPLSLLDLSQNGLKRRQRKPKFRPFVRKALDVRQRKLAKEAKDLRHSAPEPMHDIRKAAKMLRYDLDLFDTLSGSVGRKRFRAVRDALGALQETLGIIHDHEALSEHLQRIVSEAQVKEPQVKAAQVKETPVGEPGQSHAMRAAFAAGQLAARPIDRDALIAQARKAAKVLRRTQPF